MPHHNNISIPFHTFCIMNALRMLPLYYYYANLHGGICTIKGSGKFKKEELHMITVFAFKVTTCDIWLLKYAFVC